MVIQLGLFKTVLLGFVSLILIAGCSNGNDESPSPSSRISFTEVQDAERSALIASNMVTLRNIKENTAISVVNGQFRLGDGEFDSIDSIAQPNTTLQLRLLSASDFDTETSMSVVIGDQSYTFRVTTEVQDLVPDAFSFAGKQQQPRSTIVVSESVNINGINDLVPVSITGGEYSINGGAFTNITGAVGNDDVVTVRLVSSDVFSTLKELILTVGDTTAAFAVTTLAASTGSVPQALPAEFNLLEDNAVSFELEGSGSGGEDLGFEIITLPTNGTLTGDAPNLVYTPNTDFSGQDQLEFLVREGELESETAVVDFAVESVNDAPRFLSTPVRFVEEGQTYSYQVSANDVEGSDVNYRLESIPEGAQIDSQSGLISWQAAANSNGEYPIEIIASDGQLEATQAFSIVVVRSVDNPAEPEPEPAETELVNDAEFKGFDIDHSVVAIGIPKTLTFSTRVSEDSLPTVAEVGVYQVDVTGSEVSFLGNLTDEGTNGDSNENDGIYTGQYEVSSNQTETRYYRSVLTLADSTQKVSRIVPVNVTPEPYSWEINPDDLVTPEDGSPTYLPNHLIVMLADNVEIAYGELLAQKYNAEVVGFAGLPVVFAYHFTDGIDDVETLVDDLEKDPRIEAVSEIFQRSTLANNDATRLQARNSPKTNSYEDIDAFLAWDIVGEYLSSKNLSPVFVGVIDTQIDFEHPELQHINRIFTPNTASSDHGTGVTGVIAAASNGSESNGLLGGVVANGSNDMRVPLIISSGDIHLPAIDIQIAIYRGARFINMSYSSAELKGFSFDTVVNDFRVHGRLFRKNRSTIFVSAAGNNDQDARLGAPAGIDQIRFGNHFVVGGASLIGDRWRDSNHGPNITITAPAHGVWIPTSVEGVHGHELSSGTSFSAPMVTASLALLKSIDPSLQITDLKQLLLDTSDIIKVDKEMNGPMEGTARRLNIGDAVDCAIKQNEHKIIGGAGRDSGGPFLGSRALNIPAENAQIISDSNRIQFANGPDGSLFYSGEFHEVATDGRLLRFPFIRKINEEGLIESVYEAPVGLSIYRFKVLSNGDIYFARGWSLHHISLSAIEPTLTTLIEGIEGTYIQDFDVTDDGVVYYYQVSSHTDRLIKRRDPDGTTTVIADVRGHFLKDIEVGPDGKVYVLIHRIEDEAGLSAVYQISSSGVAIPWSTIPQSVNSSGILTSQALDFDIDNSGNFYVSDIQSMSLYKITPDKEIVLLHTDGPSRGSLRATVSVDKGCRVSFISGRAGVIHQFN